MHFFSSPKIRVRWVEILMISLVSSPKHHLPKDMQHSVCTLYFYQGHLGSPLFCRPPYVKEKEDYFEFIGIAIGQARFSPFLGEETNKETVTMFLNVKLEREWIFKVVNDKTVQFKTDRTERISWTDAWKQTWKNRSEKVSINIILYFLTFLSTIMEIQNM